MLLLLRLMQVLDEKETLTTGDYVKLAAAAWFVLFSRLDGIYLVLIAGVWMVFRRTSIRYLVPLDLALVFGTVVGAYIQRASLKLYMLTFTESAVLMGAVTFVLQAVIFYALGLYDHPKTQTPRQIAARALLGVTLTAGASAAVMLLLNLAGLAQMPRAVPLLGADAALHAGEPVRAALALLRQEAAVPTAFSLSSLLQQIRSQFGCLSDWLHAGLTFYGLLAAGLLTSHAAQPDFVPDLHAGQRANQTLVERPCRATLTAAVKNHPGCLYLDRCTRQSWFCSPRRSTAGPNAWPEKRHSPNPTTGLRCSCWPLSGCS